MTTTTLLSCAGLALAAAPLALADEVTLNPSKDNTIYLNGTQNLSNGAGDYIFCGMTAQFPGGNPRRGLIHFDLASIPAGSTITSVKLTMWFEQGALTATARTCTLRRALADWGEGDSNALGGEGQGAFAEPGDATWFFSFFNTQAWAAPGGEFSATVGASAAVAYFPAQDYVWGNTPELVADVQGWLDTPASNFGWFLVGDESAAGTARKFSSREYENELRRPRLLVEFIPPAPPPCYANCDESTQPPVLNVADFGCFLTRYAAAEAYANCDESTQPPVLNVADFGCFLTKYAAGCP